MREAAGTIEEILRAGAADGAWSQASVAVARHGRVVLEARLGEATVFDVASVTKVATAALALSAFDPDEPIAWLQGAPTVRALLAHASGQRAWRPLFAHAAARQGSSLADLVTARPRHAEAKRTYRELLAATPADAPVPTYSDLNFLALGIALEERTGRTLPALARSRLFEPLGLAGLQWGGERADAAPTAGQRPRPGNPRIEEELVASLRRGKRPDRAVDDDNAAAIGGEAGHAGLWGTAAELARLGDALRGCADGDEGPLSADRAGLLFTKVAGSRTLGLDTPSGETPALGSVLGRGRRGAAGHLGFTGCSLWVDRDADASIALLSDAVAIARPNPGLKAWRPRVHDAVARVLGLG